MNGIESIIGRIQTDAQAEIDRIEADAQQEAESILSGYTARADREAAEIIARGETGARQHTERLLSAARMDSKKTTLTVKQGLLDRAFDRALEKLLALDEGAYIQLLAELATNAASKGNEALIFSPDDQAKLGQKVVDRANELLAGSGCNAGLTLSAQTRAIRGGLLVSDGDVEVNCALETLVRLSRSEVTGEVSKLLFA